MSEIYQRFFRITSGPVMTKAKEIQEASDIASKAILDFCHEIGAENVRVFRDGQLAGFIFEDPPERQLWKGPNRRGEYFPKRNTKNGIELINRIDSLPKFEHIDSALCEIGLNPYVPALIDFGSGYVPTIFGSTQLNVLFVSVPWRDLDDGELDSYRKEKAEKTRWCMSFEHLLWEPTSDMVEVKRWEVEKEIDDINRKIKTLGPVEEGVEA